MLKHRSSPLLLVIAVLMAALLPAMGVSAEASPQADQRISPRTAPDGALGHWSALGTGVDDTIWGVAVSPGGDLHVAGNFTVAGGQAALGVAKWDGGSWSQVGAGLSGRVAGAGRTVSHLSFADGHLYAVGGFTRSGNTDDSGISVFDGTSWSPVGAGVRLGTSQEVLDVFVHGDSVYVGGTFTQAGPTADDSNIAIWNGSSWSNVGGGFPLAGADVRAMELTSAGDLIVGGKFTQAGSSQSAANIARWNGTTWNPLGSGLGTSSSRVYSLAISSDDTVYAGGNFPTAGGQTVKGLAQWNGSTWSAVSPGAGIDTNAVRSLVLDESRGLLYAAGGFRTMNDDTVNRITVWDQVLQQWVPFVDTGVIGVPASTGTVESIAVRGSHVYAGGYFAAAGPLAASNVAEWTWDAPEGANAMSGVPGDVVSLTGEGFIGVPTTGGVYFGGVSSPSYTRDDSTSFSSVVVPQGVYGTVPIEVDAVGGRAVIGTFTAPARPLPIPASPPRHVIASPGNGSAQVSWAAPASSGSFPVTTYLALASSGGRSCLTSTTNCTVDGLANGTAYTFTVTALTGAGWSPSSDPSPAITPLAPVTPELRIVGSRDGNRIGVAGTAEDMGMGAVLRPWVRKAGAASYEQGTSQILVSRDGTFTWSRKMGKKAHVYIATPDRSIRSNIVGIPAA